MEVLYPYPKGYVKREKSFYAFVYFVFSLSGIAEKTALPYVMPPTKS
jgi:hypothetical protein